MKLLFERTETNEQVVLVYKPHSMYVLLAILLSLMAVTFAPQLADYAWLSGPLTLAAAAVVVVRIAFMFKVNREVQNAMRRNSVDIKGGKLSMSNPLTFIISKATSKQGSDTE
jgi:hypothetical protein